MRPSTVEVRAAMVVVMGTGHNGLGAHLDLYALRTVSLLVK